MGNCRNLSLDSKTYESAFESYVKMAIDMPMHCISSLHAELEKVTKERDEAFKLLNDCVVKIKKYREQYGTEYVGGIPCQILFPKVSAITSTTHD